MAEYWQLKIAKWNLATDDMTLELEGALLRVVNATRLYDRPIKANLRVLSGLWRCNERRAKRLLSDLVATGEIRIEDGLIILKGFPEVLTREPIGACLRSHIFERDGEVCAYCGSEEGPFEIDHILPVRLGGSNCVDNLTVACRTCNRSKGAKTIAELGWLQ